MVDKLRDAQRDHKFVRLFKSRRGGDAFNSVPSPERSRSSGANFSAEFVVPHETPETVRASVSAAAALEIGRA